MVFAPLPVRLLSLKSGVEKKNQKSTINLNNSEQSFKIRESSYGLDVPSNVVFQMFGILCNFLGTLTAIGSGINLS